VGSVGLYTYLGANKYKRNKNGNDYYYGLSFAINDYVDNQ